MNEAHNAIEHFCSAINASIDLDRDARRLSLSGIRTPPGYQSVILLEADGGAPRAGASSRSKDRGPSALDVAFVVRMTRSSGVRPTMRCQSDDGVVELILTDGRSRISLANHAEQLDPQLTPD